MQQKYPNDPPESRGMRGFAVNTRVPSFCRHNRLVQNCPICSREQSIEPRPLVSPGTPRSSGTRTRRAAAHDGTRQPTTGRPSTSARDPSVRAAAGRHGSGTVRVRRLERGAEDGYRSPLVPGLKSSADAERLASEIAFAAGRLEILATAPPGLMAEVADPATDLEERTWLAFLIAYLSPLDTEQPFASIERVRTSWASGELPVIDDELELGPRTAHEPGRNAATVDAYRVWARRAGSQTAAFTGETSWTAERRFGRTFERLAFPGMHRRDPRFELLVMLGQFDCYELTAGSLQFGEANETTLAAKRLLGIGDTLLLERRASDLAQACGVPLAALDVAFHNWGSGHRSGLGVPADGPVDGDVFEASSDALGI
jgi:hypothetical protein